MKNFTLLFAALFAVLLTSCKKVSLDELSQNNDLTTQTTNITQDVVGKVSPKKTITQYLQDEDNFSTFYEALVHTNLVSVLNNSNITVFAPNNDAMKTFLEKGQYGTVQEIQPEVLRKIMEAHISVYGMYVISSDVREQEIEVLYKPQAVLMRTTDATLHFGNSITSMEVVNWQLTNGVLHETNGVLIP